MGVIKEWFNRKKRFNSALNLTGGDEILVWLKTVKKREHRKLKQDLDKERETLRRKILDEIEIRRKQDEKW